MPDLSVLLVTDKFVPERGGSQIILANAYAHLPDAAVQVVTREWAGAAESDAAYPHPVLRVPYSSIPRLRSPLLWGRLARESARLAVAGQFDQIHCGQTVETAPAGVALARRLGLPSVVHTFAEDVTTYLRHPFYLRRMRRALQGATRVTSISRFTVQQLVALGVPEERLSLLYPGVRLEDWFSRGGEAEVRRRFGLEGRRVLLTVARLIPRKGHDVVLRALPEIARKVPDVAYLVVGSGPEEVRLKSLADSLGVADRVRWAGSVAHQDAVDYYRAADLFVMPNRSMPNGDVEGFGLVFLEANACGLPVIGGRSGGTPDAVSEGVSGYLVEPTSPGEVAERVLALLEDPDLSHRLGEGGRERVARDFTWTKTGSALREIALRAAQEGPRA